METEDDILKSLGIEPTERVLLVRDLTFGIDARGDDAFFIERHHFTSEWEIDEETQEALNGKLTFFRMIEDGEQKHQHGWIEDGRVVQWG